MRVLPRHILRFFTLPCLYLTFAYAYPITAAPNQPRPLPSSSGKSTVDLSQQQQLAQEPGACHFTPPPGWNYIDPKSLPPLVKLMVVGKGDTEMPPSINLAAEETPLTPDQYINAIREQHQYDRLTRWSLLGTINTQGREVTITQLDVKTKWGEARMLQAILIHEGVAYVLTASAVKEEFPKYSNEFLKAVRTFTVNKSVFEMVPDEERRVKLLNAYHDLHESWQSYFDRVANAKKNLSREQIAYITFEESDFKAREWRPFQEVIKQDYSDLGENWRNHLFKKVKMELLQID